MGLIICELSFNDPDKNNPDYSFHEVDYYAFIPYDIQRKYNIENHRLSLRKNLKTGKFEVYRFYYASKKEEVIFAGDFEKALFVASYERQKYWGHLGSFEPDQPCKHEYPDIDKIFCPFFEK